MDAAGFRKYLEKKGLPQETVHESLKNIEDFNAFLKEKNADIDTSSRADFYDYCDILISKNQNTPEHYISILRYAYFKEQKELIIGAMEVLDGSEVIENFSQRLTAEFSSDFRKLIFKNIGMPPLGIRPGDKPHYMMELVQNLEKAIGTEKCGAFLNKGLRDRYEESRKPDREKFLRSGTIDEFLRNKHQEFVAELEHHYKDKTLFFTQEITAAVLDLAKNDSSMETGVRDGDKIVIKKIPHMAQAYLEEQNEAKKSYYYCHCPWVKEALRTSKVSMPAVFCNCSAGFYRAYWEIILDRPVEVEVLGSVLSGDRACTFAVHLPKEFIPQR